jgi:hypothetical protein
MNLSFDGHVVLVIYQLLNAYLALVILIFMLEMMMHLYVHVFMVIY